MAKKSSIEKNNRRTRFDQEILGPARAAEGHCARQEQADRGPLCGDAQVGGTAAQFVTVAYSQPVRDHRAPEGLLPQAPDEAVLRCGILARKALSRVLSSRAGRSIERWP